MFAIFIWISILCDKVNTFFESCRRRLVEYGAELVNRVIRAVVQALCRTDVFEVESKVQELQKTDFEPLSRSTLSFFDNFQILNGIPVFVLHPADYRTPDNVNRYLNPSPMQGASSSNQGAVNWDEVFRTQSQVMCTKFSPNAELLVSGHHDGSIFVWDAEHGTFNKIIRTPHTVPVADLNFYGESNKFLIACDFSGIVSIHDVTDPENCPVVVNCGSNWEKTRMPSVEGQWPKLCPYGKLLVCPVQVVIENKPNRTRGGGEETSTRIFSRSCFGRFGVSEDTIGSLPSRSGTDFSHFCILHIFNTRDEKIVRNSVYGDAEGKAYNWGENINLKSISKLYVPISPDSHDYAISSTELSFSGKGLLIGVNSRPEGHLIMWPDFKERPLFSYRLDGMVGKWSPCDKIIASWDVPLQSSPDLDLGECYIWRTDEILKSTQKCTQNGNNDHPRYIGQAKWTLRCPSKNPIYWCDFVNIYPKVIGMASCSVGDLVMVVLWDLENGVPVQEFHTGVRGDSVKLSMRQAWAERWVLARPSWGLSFISTSQERNRLGFFSLETNKGIVWDTEKRIQKLWLSVNDKNGEKDLSLTNEMDFNLSPCGEKFVTACEDTLMIWCPQQLQSKEQRGSNWVSLASSDPELGGGKLRCKFSKEGDHIGLMRLFCTVMNVWDLSSGTNYTLRLPMMDKTLEVESEEADMSTSSGICLLTESRSRTSSTTAADKTKGFCQFCISMDGSKAVTCMGDNSVLLWELKSKTPEPIEVAKLSARYCAAWDVCFCDGNLEHPDTIVVCEDTGHLVWIDFSTQPASLDRREAGGKKRCTFSADGKRAILMPDDIQVKIWDLVSRQMLFSCTYNVWLGKSGIIKFPHNVAFDGKSSLVGLDGTGRTVLCDPTTTYEQLRAIRNENRLVSVPHHVKVTEDMKWFVADSFQEILFASPSTKFPNRMSSATPQTTHATIGSLPLSLEKAHAISERELRAQSSLAEEHPLVQTVVDPLQRDSPSVKYPGIQYRLANEHLWDYLRGGGPDHQMELRYCDRLKVMSMDGIGTEKELYLPGLCPDKFLTISHNGRKIACLGDGNKLQVWTPNAAEGCIPTTLTVLHLNQKDENYLVEQFERFGPGILNHQDHAGLSLALTAVYRKDVVFLRSLLGWAKSTNLKVSLRDELSDQKDNETQTLNALNLALGYRSPEVTRLILKYLLDGVCTELETSEILQDSLVRLSGVYPSILLKILDSQKLMLQLEELTVPEWAFTRSEYKVVASDELIPTRENLYQMWVTEGLEKQDGVLRRSEFKRTSAYARVIPYPNIAQIGMDGILRPLLFNRVPHHIYATWPIRCVIKYKWGLYGKKLVIEDFIHYLVLLFFFTLYTLLIGFLVKKENRSPHDLKYYKEGTSLVLGISMILAIGPLVRKLIQVREMWQNKKWKGIFYWSYDYWNMLELTFLACIVILVPIAATRSPSSKLLAGALACSCILLWGKTLYYAQAFKSTGPLVIMIREIVKDIRFYLFLVFAILMGFTIAFFVLFRTAKYKDCEHREDTKSCLEARNEITSLFGTFDRSLVTMFAMILGEVSDVASILFKVDNGLKFVGIVMFTLYMLAVTIVLLNLLIAIMGDGFDRVKATDMSYFLQKRAQIIDDMESMITKKRADDISATIKKYLHVLLPKYKSDTHPQASEWQGRMKDAQDRYKQETMKIFSQFSGMMATMTENQNHLANRIDELARLISNPSETNALRTLPQNQTTSERNRFSIETFNPVEESDIDDLFERSSFADTI